MKNSELLLRAATLSDMELLLTWRNDAETRKYSHNTEYIDRESHLAWLDSSLRNPKRHIYIAEVNSVEVATIRVDSIKDKDGCLLSWCVAPEFRGKGLAKKLLHQALKTIDTISYAEIKNSNLASIKIAISVGFNLIDESDDTGLYSRSIS